MVTRRVGLKLGGKFIGSDPASPAVVYADRDALGGWEVAILTKQDDGTYFARLEATGKAICVTPERAIESRDNVGGWETFRAGEIPPDWPPKLIHDHGLVFDVVYA